MPLIHGRRYKNLLPQNSTVLYKCTNWVLGTGVKLLYRLVGRFRGQSSLLLGLLLAQKTLVHIWDHTCVCVSVCVRET